MSKLVTESLNEFVEPNKEFTLNEELSPDALFALQSIVGSLSVLGGATAIAAIQKNLSKSDNKNKKKLAAILGKLGKSAAAGTEKAPPSI